MLEGISELMAEHNQSVLENLAVSLKSLTFRHLLSLSLSARQQLSLFLHRLIHHGAVDQLSMYSWPDPDPVVLALILKMSAGGWHPGKAVMNPGKLCHLCQEKSVDQKQKLDQESKKLFDSRQQFHKSAASRSSDKELRNEKVLPRLSQEFVPGFKNAIELARTNNKILQDPGGHELGCNSYQNRMQYCAGSERDSADEGSVSSTATKSSQDAPALGRSQKRRKVVATKKHSCSRRATQAATELDDLYDFVFAVAREEEGESKRRHAEEGNRLANCFQAEAADGTGVICPEGAQPIGITPLKMAASFRSVSMLEVFSIPLTRNMCQMLGNLLSSWVSLEKLVLTLNGLGPGILNILSGLRALSRHSNYCLRVVHISDMFSHVPCMNLVHSFLSAVPLLQTLLVSFDLRSTTESSKPEESSGLPSLQEEIPESHLEHLDIRFPREPLQTSLLLPVLKASRSLQSLSLDSVAISCPEEVGFLLHALREYSPSLRKLSFHDINLSSHSKEVLFLLQDHILQEITFSFCRLFENCTAELLSEIINVVKNNSSLKSLRLPGNRLGNHRLVALADIFSEDSSSSICFLDVSSNCIKPDGLLEFAKKLESYVSQRGEHIKFTKLCLYQNWLDQDAVTAQEALLRLKAMCNVVSDTWDSSQAFADYISVM
uniref:Leucine-rich repeat-containing protein 41 n=3 Tax=Varanus komodoensis TaxID=61221 RepID=A0A8D2KS72_VARKO